MWVSSDKNNNVSYLTLKGWLMHLKVRIPKFQEQEHEQNKRQTPKTDIATR
jgi:hypothetical protein